VRFVGEPLIYSRAAWNAAPPLAPLELMAYPVRKVYVHHVGGGIVGSMTPEQEQAFMRQLQQGAFGDGYLDFPYGMSVFASGRAYEGRDLRFEGAATGGENDDSVAVLLVGNFELQQPTTLALLGAARVIQLGQYVGRITLDATINGHKDAPQASTACPGSHLYAALPVVRALVKAVGPQTTTVEVKPMYDPPLGPIAAVWRDSSGKVIAAVSPDGAVYAWGCDYKGGANGQDYFVGKRAAQIRAWRDGDFLVDNKPGTYTVVSTSGHRFCY
jgi:hypothetical protein